jgi:hypothetical protein
MDELGLLLYPIVPDYETFTERYRKLDKFGKEKDVIEITFKSKNGVMTWLDAETGEKLEIPFIFVGTQDDISKAYGSALTYSERYFLLKFLNIATDKDDPDAFQKKYEEKEIKETKIEVKPTSAKSLVPELKVVDTIDSELLTKVLEAGKKLYTDDWEQQKVDDNIDSLDNIQLEKKLAFYLDVFERAINATSSKIESLINSIKEKGDRNHKNVHLIRKHKSEKEAALITHLLGERLASLEK